MEVIKDVSRWTEDGIAATTGFFDGVHSGHRFLLGELRRIALARRLPAAVITFPVHPGMILQADYRPRLLNSFDEKLELLASTGIDYAVVMDFTPSLAALTARAFITDVLSAQWRVRTLLVGHDHRFGRLRAEGMEQYAVYGRECGMEVVGAGAYGENGRTFSSSGIRQRLQQGDVAGAARILGYFYRLKGRVIDGRKIGRTLGFPTANIAVDEKCKEFPATGSYAVWVSLGCRSAATVRRLKGMLYIGSRPTVEEAGGVSVEVHIFDFADELYDETVTAEFVGYIRADRKFDSLEELKAQMQADRTEAERILEKSQKDSAYGTFL